MMPRAHTTVTRAGRRVPRVWPLLIAALAFCVAHAEPPEAPLDYTIQRSYYDPAETILKSEIGFADGVAHGPLKLYYDSGQLQTSATMVHGVLQGEMKQYDTDGHLIRTATFVDGELDGEDRRFFATGKLARVTPMKAGKKQGVEIVYTRTGQKVWERPYDQGKLHGTVRAWDEAGTLLSTETYDHAADPFGDAPTTPTAP